MSIFFQRGGESPDDTTTSARNWKIDRTINPSHIIVVAAYILAAIVLWVKMDTRITTLESAQAKYDTDSKALSDVKTSVAVIESGMSAMTKNQETLAKSQEKLADKVDELLNQGRR